MSDNEIWEALQEDEEVETGETLDVIATGNIAEGVMTIQGEAGPSKIILVLDTKDERCYGVADQLIGALPNIVEKVMAEIARKQAEGRSDD